MDERHKIKGMRAIHQLFVKDETWGSLYNGREVGGSWSALPV